ncbi:MAG: hypothetical protein AAFY50_06305 [Cyanobacteria bacterium J06648_1]
MLFRPTRVIGANQSERKLWQALQSALEQEPGRAYLGFRPRHPNGRIIKESDVLIIHPEYGICVIECKGCQIEEIDYIDGDEWHMKEGWYSKTMQPLNQAKDAVFAVKKEVDDFIKYKLDRPQALYINNTHLVALPCITRQQWLEREFNELPTLRGAVLLQEDLTPENIRRQLTDCIAIRQSHIDDELWSKIWNFCTRDGTRQKVARKSIEPISAVRLMNQIQYESLVLDGLQKKVANSIPPGPQRLRGLAGTGKTVLLAMRAAKMHCQYPDWDIAFVFFTKSLYSQTCRLIEIAYRELLNKRGEEQHGPNWDKLKVLHSWGGKKGGGFYADLALSNGLIPRIFNDVKNKPEQKGREFAYVCDHLESELTFVNPNYDAIIIDEGQDLPLSFYRLAYNALREPKRLYWAYDEAQGVNSLIVPNSESIFGRDGETGELLVDLRGQYEGGAQKSYIMNSCYRSPRLLLMVGHAINMGLFRTEGILQGVTTKADWKDLGYEVSKDSDFLDRSVKAGKSITITRLDENSPHEVDKPGSDFSDLTSSLLETHSFDSDNDERDWIAESVAKDINLRGFNPQDILITGVYGEGDREYLTTLKQALEKRGISAYHVGVDGNAKTFQRNDSVTIAHIFYAKGNEAWKVYACRFDYANNPWRSHETILHKRNEAFAALTRSKAWCVVTGCHSPIFDELNTAISAYPNFTFPAFNQKSLARITNDENSSDTL